MKKILSLALALMLLAAMAIPAMAAVTKDTAVSVSGLQSDDVVKFYHVLDWDQDNGVWVVNSQFAALKNSTAFPDDEDEDTDDDAEVVAAILDGITQDEANAIAALAKNATAINPDDVVTNGTSTYTLPKTSGEVNDAALGLYMAIITAGSPSYIYNPVFVSADFAAPQTGNTNTIDAASATYGANGLAKKQDITLLKTTSDTANEIATAIDSYRGQTVTFYVDTTIPVFLDSYQNPSFDIIDTVDTAGIQLDYDTIEVTLNYNLTSAKTYAKVASGDKEAYDNTKFTVTTNDMNAANAKYGYTVSFTKDYLDGNLVAVPVHIEYQGVITNEAEFNVNEDDNTVDVYYSNGPGTEKAALRDRTNHYVFSIGAKAVGATSDKGRTFELVKVAVDSEGNPIVEEHKVSEWETEVKRHPLAGAVFGLFTDEECEHPYVYGEYADTNKYPHGAQYTTDEYGVITFKGLAAGTYYVKELDAPSGYVKDTKVATVVIDAHYTNVNVPATTDSQGIKVAGYSVDVLDYYTVTVNGVSVYTSNGDDDGTYGATSNNVVSKYEFNNDGPHTTTIKPATTVNDADFVNTPGVELPSTGGIGTTIFYVAGSILVLAAVIFLVTKRRMHANED